MASKSTTDSVVARNKKALHEYGVTREDLPEFAHRVMATQQRLMRNCFVPLDEAQVLDIFEKLY